MDATFIETIVRLRSHHILAQIPDFTQLAALSHIHGIPVNGLQKNHMTAEEATGEHVLLSGNKHTSLWKKKMDFSEIVNALTENVRQLVNIKYRRDSYGL